jgi:hypothetical protein
MISLSTRVSGEPAPAEAVSKAGRNRTPSQGVSIRSAPIVK